MTDTILDHFFRNVAKYGDERMFMTQPMGKKVKYWTFTDTLTESKRLASFIYSLELPLQSHIAICSKNCAWWIMADLAIWMTGNVSVSIYPNMSADSTRYILEHSGVQLLFIGVIDPGPWNEIMYGIPEDLMTISFPVSPQKSAHYKWKDVIKGQPIADHYKRGREELATIIYTRGTIGAPKGIMTSFHAMTCATEGFVELHNVTEEDRYLSYYPMANSMERWLGECLPLYTGMELFFSQSEDTFAADMDRARPTIFFADPLQWANFQAGVSEKKQMYSKIPLVKGTVKKKILKKMGLGKTRLAFSVSTHLSLELLSWYKKNGLEILESYGMAEVFHYSHMSRVGDSQPGSVGVALDGVEHHIADDGEIHILSPCHMLGYYGDDTATMSVMAEDGWIRTGDRGSLDNEGRLEIHGRIADIFETSEGVFVAPSPIEDLITSNSLIETACVCGSSYPQPLAVLQLCRDSKDEAAKGETEREKITSKLEEHFEAVNLLLDEHERLSFFIVVFDDWLPENGFLTPTLETRRAAVEDVYRPEIDGWYEFGTNARVTWSGWPLVAEGEEA